MNCLAKSKAVYFLQQLKLKNLLYTTAIKPIITKSSSTPYNISNSLVKNNIIERNNSSNKIRYYSTLSSEETKTSHDDIPSTSLDPLNHKSWTKEQVCSLLCTEELNGGCDLSIETVKELYNSNFNGLSLNTILIEIETFGLEETLLLIGNDYPNVPKPILTRVVLWVESQFKTFLKNKEVINVELIMFSLPNEITKENVKSLNLDKRFLFPKGDSPFPQGDILLRSFGKKFKFVERSYILDEILSIYRNRNTFGSEKIDKANVVLPFIAAAPGLGKSRLLKEVAINVSNTSIRKSIPTIPILITFGNGFDIINSMEKQNKLQSLICRMIYSTLLQRSNSNSYQFEAFLNEWIKFSENREFTLSETLIMISDILGYGFENVDFFLAIDEAHLLGNELQNIASIIGHYISMNNLNHKLYVLFAGTHFTIIYNNLIQSILKVFSPKNIELP